MTLGDVEAFAVHGIGNRRVEAEVERAGSIVHDQHVGTAVQRRRAQEVVDALRIAKDQASSHRRVQHRRIAESNRSVMAAGDIHQRQVVRRLRNGTGAKKLHVGAAAADAHAGLMLGLMIVALANVSRPVPPPT